MNSPSEETSRAITEIEAMRQAIASLQETLDVQRRVSYAAGLFQSEVTVRTLIGSLAEGLIVIDRDQRIVLINEQASELLGYARDECVGQFLDIILPDRFHEVHQLQVSSFFQTPHVRPMGQGLELVARRKDGTEFPVEVSLSYLDTESGRFGLAFFTDIMLRKQAERVLQEQNEALNTFAYTVAHDLQTSLAVLIGLSDALAEDHSTLSEAELRRHLVTISKQGEKMSGIIREVLLLASMRKEEVATTALEMAPIVEAALQRLQYVIQESQAEIRLPDKYPQALGYGPWVEEVWLNYLSNALKYGGQPPRIEIGSTLQDDGYIKFWVRDNGPGLTPAQQAQLFQSEQPLTRLRVKGHGLGLSIVRQIMRKIDGHVAVESEVGRGSTFSFSLLKTRTD